MRDMLTTCVIWSLRVSHWHVYESTRYLSLHRHHHHLPWRSSIRVSHHHHDRLHLRRLYYQWLLLILLLDHHGCLRLGVKSLIGLSLGLSLDVVHCLLLLLLLVEVACAELEFREVNKDLFQWCSCQLEIFNETLRLILIQDLEDLTKLRLLPLLSMTERYYLIEQLNLVTHWRALSSTYLFLALRERLQYLLIHMCGVLPHPHGHREWVPVSVLLLQVTGRADAHEAAVDHDCDFVAEGLGLVHAVGSQHNRRVLQVLQHFEETAAGDRVDAGRRLV